MKTHSQLYTFLVLSQGLFAAAQDATTSNNGPVFVTAPPGQLDLTPPDPQPNDVDGTVFGCANAVMNYDDNGDGVVTRGEYLDFVNEIADLLCIPPRPVLDLELQTVFITISCLCEDIEGTAEECCFGPDAGMYVAGATDLDTRTAEQESYLRGACLLTQAVLGPDQCIREPVTIPPGVIGGIGRETPAPVVEDDNDELYWLFLLLLLLICCCICCCCKRNDKELEEEYETTVKEEIVTIDPEKPEPFEEPPVPQEMARAMPPLVPPPPAEEPEPFNAGDEAEEEGAAPKPGPPSLPVPPVVPDEEDEDGAGRRFGEAPDEDGDDEFGRKFKGQGDLPPPPEYAGLKLRHIEKEPPIEQDYEYPERNIEEFKLKREDSAQVLDHYVPDGGVFIPERAKKAPVEMPNPNFERQKKPEPVYIDPRKQRSQMALGDGEVWDALANWEDELQKEGHVDKVDWVIHSALTAFAGAEETGELLKEDDSDEEYDDGEE